MTSERKKQMGPLVRRTVRLPQRLDKKLQDAAKNSKRSVNKQAEHLIEAGLTQAADTA